MGNILADSDQVAAEVGGWDQAVAAAGWVQVAVAAVSSCWLLSDSEPEPLAASCTRMEPPFMPGPRKQHEVKPNRLQRYIIIQKDRGRDYKNALLYVSKFKQIFIRKVARDENYKQAQDANSQMLDSILGR
jgi:hypothetical protein